MSARRDGWLAWAKTARLTLSLSAQLLFLLPSSSCQRVEIFISRDRDPLIARARAGNALFSARPRHLDDMVVELSRFYLVSVPPCSFLSCCCAAPTSLYLSLYLTVVAFLRFSPATTSVYVYTRIGLSVRAVHYYTPASSHTYRLPLSFSPSASFFLTSGSLLLFLFFLLSFNFVSHSSLVLRP